MNKPLISIITVCYNSEATIGDTIESVLNQTYDNIEYILIDGNSKDSTIEIIKSYEERFKDKGIIYKWISEPDKGIYDAMNKGIGLASGKWLNFMNSGDIFFNSNVISVLTEDNIIEDTSVIYGNVLIEDVIKKTKRVLNYPKVDLDFFLKSTICHQAAFVSSSVFENYGKYDTKYKIVADYDKFFDLAIDNKKFLHKDVIVCNYKNDGYSSINNIQSAKERMSILNKKYKRKHIRIYSYYVFLIVKAFAYNFVLKIKGAR